MRRDAERFKSLDGYGRSGRHMGLVADGLGQLTPQFIEVIDYVERTRRFCAVPKLQKPGLDLSVIVRWSRNATAGCGRSNPSMVPDIYT
jgi:hypothetical protein